jgi:hypothetical protein
LVLSQAGAARIGQRLIDQLGPREQLEDELLIIRDDAVMRLADKLGITFETAREIYTALQQAVTSSTQTRAAEGA